MTEYPHAAGEHNPYGGNLPESNEAPEHDGPDAGGDQGGEQPQQDTAEPHAVENIAGRGGFGDDPAE